MNTTQHIFKLIVCLQIALCIVFDRTVAVAVIRVGESVESALSALVAIFSALSASFNNFRQKIPYFDVSRQKRVLFNCFATKQCLGMLKM